MNTRIIKLDDLPVKSGAGGGVSGNGTSPLAPGPVPAQPAAAPRSRAARAAPTPLGSGPQLHQTRRDLSSAVRLRPLAAENRLWVAVSHLVRIAVESIATALQGAGAAARAGHLVRRHALEMRGLWVKLAATLGDHWNVFPEAFCDPLLRIHDRTDGFPFADVQRVVKSELKRPLEDIYDEFDPVPLAATFTSQTHRAHLRREGMWVAVKVQRPGILEILRSDLRIIRAIGPLLRAVTGIPGQSWREALWGFQHTLVDEQDYRLECAHMKRMTRRLRRHGVLVPRVFLQYSGRTVITKEFVTGVSVSEYLKATAEDPARAQQWLTENGIAPKKVGVRLYHSLMRQVMEEDLYHSDWNPMNAILLRGNRVALVDFYAMQSLDKAFQKKYLMLNRAIVQREFRKAADYFMLIGPALPPYHDPTQLRSDIIHALRVFDIRSRAKLVPYQEKSLTVTMGEIARILTRDGAPPTLDFLRIGRAFRVLELSVEHLLPSVNLMRVLERYWRRADLRAMRRNIEPAAVKRTVAGAADLLARTPEMLTEQFFFESEMLRRRAKVFQQTSSKIADFFVFLTGAGNKLMAAGLALQAAGSIYKTYPGLRPVFEPLGSRATSLLQGLPDIASFEGALLALVTGYLLAEGIRLKRRFAQKDISRPDGRN